MKIRANQSRILPVIVIGGGGHAKVLISTLLQQHRNVLGFVEPEAEWMPAVLGVTQLGNDDATVRFPKPNRSG